MTISRLLSSISKKAFLWAGMAVLAANAAWATNKFVDYAFPATGASANRKDPDRWADWRNVKEYGAVGNGVLDDTVAIQACINSFGVLNIGTIYFPRATSYYKTSAPLIIPVGSSSGVFIGDGDASHILGNFQGFIFDRYDPNYQDFLNASFKFEKLKITNLSTTPWSGTVYGVGAVRLASCLSTAVRNCTITGFLGLVFNSNELFSWRASLVSGNHDPMDLAYLHAISGTLSVTINGTVFSGVVNFSASASYEAAAAQMQTALTDGMGNNLSEQVFFSDAYYGGVAAFIFMNLVPFSPSSITYATGTAAAALKLTSGTAYAPGFLQNKAGTCNKPANTDGTWAGGNKLLPNCYSFPEIEVSDTVFLPVAGSITTGSIALLTGDQMTISNTSIDGYDVGIGSTGAHAVTVFSGKISNCNTGVKPIDQFGDLQQAVFFANGTQFVNNDTAINGSGGFSLVGVSIVGNGGQYGLRIYGGGGTQYSVFNSLMVSGSFSVAGISVEDFPAQHGSDPQRNIFIGCSSVNSGSGDAWVMPLNVSTSLFFNNNCPSPEFTFLTLPDAGTSTPPTVGDEYLVKDSPTALAGNFATAVTVGGSSNHVKLRWDGSQWIIV